MKKPIVLVVVAAFLLVGFIIVSNFSSGGRSSASSVKAGGTIKFGRYDWRVLDVRDGKALIITEDIIEKLPYHSKFMEVTWETCDLRRYLNGGFLHEFTAKEQRRIAETKISNPNNLWYGTNGGNDTTDKIFLLSLEEADKYFGDSGDYQNKRRKDGRDLGDGKFEIFTNDDGPAFSNANDVSRIAKYGDEALWWWLRSPGGDIFSAALVFDDGYVVVVGVIYGTGRVRGGVRPALWLNL